MHYVKYLIVPEDVEQVVLDRYCGSDVPFFGEIVFADGARMVIDVVTTSGDRGASLQTQGVLYDNHGTQLTCTKPNDGIFGIYEARDDVVTYSVIITTSGNVQFHNDVIFMAELLDQVANAGVFSPPGLPLPLGAAGCSRHELDCLLHRVRHRLDVVRRRENGDNVAGYANSLTLVSDVLRDTDWSLHDVLVALCSFIDSCGLEDHLDAYLSAMSMPRYEDEPGDRSHNLGYSALWFPEERHT